MAAIQAIESFKGTVLITGGAGFIGSNLAIRLAQYPDIMVRIIDDLSTGYLENLSSIIEQPNVQWMQGSICDADFCHKACAGVHTVFHHAALGSVPRSIDNPQATNAVNVDGFLNMLHASVRAGVSRFIYASSSSVYGDDAQLPKVEERTGNLLSPYAVSKATNELYAAVFNRVYNLEVIGLRYFNVFGPRQNVNGPYAAVIPIFITNLYNGAPCTIFGDGTTTRDFTFVENVVDANLCAAQATNPESLNRIYNIACGGTTSLNELFGLIAAEMQSTQQPDYKPRRTGDIASSLAAIDKARTLLGFTPAMDVQTGLRKTVAWYTAYFKATLTERS
jgi:UDP-N-acetylglucosamine/UDP-N-acetylgalactosamine 4-epimerase